MKELKILETFSVSKGETETVGFDAESSKVVSVVFHQKCLKGICVCRVIVFHNSNLFGSLSYHLTLYLSKRFFGNVR